MDFEQLINIIDNVPLNWHKCYSKQDKLDYLQKTLKPISMKSYITVKELLAQKQNGDIIYTEITNVVAKTKQITFDLKNIKWSGEENKPGILSFETEDNVQHTINGIMVEDVISGCQDLNNFKVDIYRIKL